MLETMSPPPIETNNKEEEFETTENSTEELDKLSLESAIKQAKDNTGEMNVEATQLTTAYELGIPANEFTNMNTEERQKAIQDALEHTDDKQLLTKLRSGATGKALKLMFAIGGTLLAGSSVVSAETGSTPDTDSDNEDQEGEKMLNWPQIDNSVMKHLKVLREIGVSQTQIDIFLHQSIDSAQAIQDNRGSTEDVINKIDSIFNAQYNTKFYEDPENRSQLKEFQYNSNKLMEKAEMTFGNDLSNEQFEQFDKKLNAFQAETWDWADHCVKNGYNSNTFDVGTKKIFNRHFEKYINNTEDTTTPDTIQNDVNETSIKTETKTPYEITVKGFQSHANDLMDKAGVTFGDNVTNEQLDAFQTEAWSFADYCAQQNDDNESSYKYGVKQIYNNHFSAQIEQQNQAQLDQAEKVVSEMAFKTIDIDTVQINEAWLTDNIDNVFLDGDNIYVVKEGVSRDMQTAVNKAALYGRADLAKIINQMNDTDDGVVEMSKIMQRKIIPVDGKYQAIVIIQTSLSNNVR